MARNIEWSGEEERILRDHYNKIPKDSPEWKKLLPLRTLNAIAQRASMLGVSKQHKKSEHRRWLDSEKEYILTHADTPLIEQAEYLKRSYQAVALMRFKLLG